MPGIFFFKYLARKPKEYGETFSTINRLKLWIPDTICVNDKDMPPIWIYSAPNGFVYRTDTFTTKNIIHKMNSFTSPDELVSVVKKPSYFQGEFAGNDAKLVSNKELQNSLSIAISNRGELSVFQKYIKSNGPKSFIVRTVWRKGKNAFCYIITNKSDFYTKEPLPEIQKYTVIPKIINSCTIVYSCRGQQVEQTAPYLENIVNFLWANTGAKFEELAGDFIKDESGIWWLINIKGFKLESNLPIDVRPITKHGDEEVRREKPKLDSKHQKMKMCRYCETMCKTEELIHKMTNKMIMHLDQHLIVKIIKPASRERV